VDNHKANYKRSPLGIKIIIDESMSDNANENTNKNSVLSKLFKKIRETH
jgi:hypothetical protein